MVGLPMAYHALGRKADSDKALAALIAKSEKDGPYNIAYVYAYRGEADQAFGVARQGDRVRRQRPLRDRDGKPVRQDPHRPTLAAVPAQGRLFARPTGEDRVQGDVAAAMSMRMDSTALTTSLHGLRGMGLILNLRYPQPAPAGNLRLYVA